MKHEFSNLVNQYIEDRIKLLDKLEHEVSNLRDEVEALYPGPGNTLSDDVTGL